MYYNLKVEPVLFEKKHINSNSSLFSYDILTYWVQVEPTDRPVYRDSVLVGENKELGDGCYLIEVTEEIDTCLII